MSIIFSIALTDGGLAVWTIQEFFPTYALPELIGNLTMPKVVAIVAVYK